MQFTFFALCTLIFFSSCFDQNSPAGDSSGNLVLHLPRPSHEGRAVVKPADSVLSLVEYHLVFTGPGGETISMEVELGQDSVSLTLSTGVWNIAVEAWLPQTQGAALYVGSGSAQVTVEPGKTASADITMVFENTG